MGRLRDMLGIHFSSHPPEEEDEPIEKLILQEEQKKRLQDDIEILDDEEGELGERLRREAEKEVESAAEDSLKRIHVVQMGRCPECGEHLHQHLFASICEACGWHVYDTPIKGPVRVHLRSRAEPIEGDRCYVVKTGFVLVVKDDLVIARVPRDAYDYIEYLWDEKEIDERHRNVVDKMTIWCGWCGKEVDPGKEGFHLVHVAFGSTQERYCFCSDECYEAFRKMYPSRVHRNCYNRSCADCHLCIKRYDDEADGIRTLAKDYLKSRRKG